MKALMLIAALSLGACSTLSHTPSIAFQQEVFSAENDFAVVLPVAVAYEQLPLCGTAAAVNAVCAQASVIIKINAAARSAQAALATAQAAAQAPNNLTALETAALQAQGDVAAFRTLVEALAK